MMREKHTQERDTRDARYDGLFVGSVVDNDDPEGHGRIKVLVPGLLEPESRWAMPIGRMWGVKDGIHAVPDLGANVCVWLLQGDPDHPYWAPGPWGAPDGESDIPEQAPSGSTDHVVLRWRDFHFTFDGTPGAEKLTIEDLGSETVIEIDRQTGDYTRDVEGSEHVMVKTDRDVTVEEGDERHEVSLGNYAFEVVEGDETHDVTAGQRTTTIFGDDTKTITSGDEIKTLTAGNKLQTLVAGNETKDLTLGNSTENMPVGTKAINALNVNITATNQVTIQGQAGASLLSSGGPITTNAGGVMNETATGLKTETLNGGVLSTIVGAFVRSVTGAYTVTVTGVLSLLAATVNIGSGPSWQTLCNAAFATLFSTHTHSTGAAPGAPTSPPLQPVIPATHLTINTLAS